jgi:hypothetical protein
MDGNNTNVYYDRLFQKRRRRSAVLINNILFLFHWHLPETGNHQGGLGFTLMGERRLLAKMSS